MVDLNPPPPMYASATVIDPDLSSQSPIAHLPLNTISESQVSALVGSPAVPKGKYRIVPAVDPTRALEMQSGENFKVHVTNLDESRKNQIVSRMESQRFGMTAPSHFFIFIYSQWKIAPLADIQDDTKYRIKNDMNCGILGITKFKDDTGNVSVNCSLQEYFWTIEPRGRAFVCAFHVLCYWIGCQARRLF